jgi:hypothetical protein
MQLLAIESTISVVNFIYNPSETVVMKIFEKDPAYLSRNHLKNQSEETLQKLYDLKTIRDIIQ